MDRGVQRTLTEDAIGCATPSRIARKENEMIFAALLIVLAIVLAGYLPVPPQSDFWSYYPSGGANAALLILLILLLLGRP
jgi:uncharacterized protein DUF3309